jgi:EAL domain-containing protein (putative c-di-GMP-specific phosphodiesterase class I)
MAHNLKMRVVAEGVETEEQLAFLKAQDCDEMQVYLLSKPLPPDEVEAYLTGKKIEFCSSAAS